MTPLPAITPPPAGTDAIQLGIIVAIFCLAVVGVLLIIRVDPSDWEGDDEE